MELDYFDGDAAEVHCDECGAACHCHCVPINDDRRLALCGQRWRSDAVWRTLEQKKFPKVSDDGVCSL